MADKKKRSRGTKRKCNLADYNKTDADLVTRILAEDNVNYYCYILVRRDLPTAVQVVQAAHAAQEVGYESQRPMTPTHFVVLGVSGVRELEFYSKLLTDNSIQHHMFFEPDYDTGHTAICTYPKKGKLPILSHLTLLGQEPCSLHASP